MEMRCLLQTTTAHNVQNGIGRCNKTFNKYVNKAGEHLTEVIADYGKGLTTRAEVTPNKIRQIMSDGSVVTYTRNHFGDVLIHESTSTSIGKNPNLWEDLTNYIFKGMK